MSNQYRKKPVVITAVRWDETKTTLRLLESMGMNASRHSGHLQEPERCYQLGITTLEGTMRVSFGDMIIKGGKGEFYPCKPDIFEATYEEVLA